MHDAEKLKVLLAHWIEHNEEHAADFLRWAGKAGRAEAEVRGAAEAMETVNQKLSAALRKLEAVDSDLR